MTHAKVGDMKKILNLLTLPILCLGLVSCQVKGMYASAKTGGIPVPYNISVMKKSAKDIQAATGPGYTYYSETVNGDETLVPKSLIRAWGTVEVARSLAEATTASVNALSKTEIAKSADATKVATGAQEADVAIKTFVAPE